MSTLHLIFCSLLLSTAFNQLCMYLQHISTYGHWLERKKEKSPFEHGLKEEINYEKYMSHFAYEFQHGFMLQQAIQWRTGAKGKHCKGGYLFTTIRCGGYNHTAKMPTKGHNTSVQSQVPEETFGCRHKQSLSASEKKRKLKAKLTVRHWAI